MNDPELAALRAELMTLIETLRQELAELRESRQWTAGESVGPDQEDAIVQLRELLQEARYIAWDYHHGKRSLYGTRSLPWPDWITDDESPLGVFVPVEGADNPPAGSRLARALWQRDEARLWAHGDYHRLWRFHTDVVPLWLHSTTLPADPEIVREWQRRHPERRVED